MLTKMEKQIIQEKANTILANYKYDNQEGYFDIVKFAIKEGFEVGESKHLLDTDDGFIYISKNPEARIIGVNYNRTKEEKRFIVAHELSHYYLHYDENQEGVFMRREHIKGKNEKENDADFLAACILMPQKNFISKYNKLQKEKLDAFDIIDYLQAIYKTPRESIIRRIEEVTK